jgi:hypothetical protein
MNPALARHADTFASFLINAPRDALRCEIRYRPGIGPQEVLLALDVPKAIEKGPASVAESIIAQCHAWQQGQGQECGFVAQMYDGAGTVLGTQQWRMGSDMEHARPLDGTVESLLAQSQTHIHAVLALHIQGFNTIQSAYKATLEMKDRRIADLEARLDKAEKTAQNGEVLEHDLAIAALEEERFGKLLGAGERILNALAEARKQMGPGASAKGAGQAVSKAIAAAEAVGDAIASSTAATPAAAAEGGAAAGEGAGNATP